MNILTVERLTKSYLSNGREVHALQDVSFALASGEICAVMGPSGSGKTTLLGLCAGLDRPSAGRVLLEEQALGECSEAELARVRNECLGFIFQSYQLLPTLTALENVMVPLELAGSPNARTTALDWLGRVGLEDRASHFPAELSGGEQQRTAIARAFANRPRLLLADEPTGNLDLKNGEKVAELLFRLNREEGTTLLIATHDSVLASRTHRTLRLRGGMLLC